MAASSVSALAKRKTDDALALMPPPPTKRIKRPAKVLDEDDYTSALSQIIARDYFPGLLETKLQQEYLTALESNNEAWIAEAGEALRQAMTSVPSGKRRRSARNTRFDTPSATPQHAGNVLPAAATPGSWTGGETPASEAGSDYSTASTAKPEIDTSNLSLGAFQAKYTSEDNESFNALLDKQNSKKRQKHAYLWAAGGILPSARQIAQARDQRLLAKNTDEGAYSKALIPLTAGTTDSRSAKPDSWKTKRFDNTFMFNTESVEEQGLESIADMKEANSKAPPRQVVYSNTRFPTQALHDDGPIPRSPSLNTTIIARRDAARAAHSETEYSGGETPRVNGYAFVDEDEPENIPQPEPSAPSYRDLLAGQVGDGTPNPFRIAETRKREDLHLRMVEKENAKKRTKTFETAKGSILGLTPVGDGGRTSSHNAGNMTPAARKLMEKLGRRPVSTAGSKDAGMWTPGRTPRRKV